MAFAVFLGLAGFTNAQGPMTGYHGMNPEQYKTMQDAYVEFDKKIQPLRQQLYAKQAELDMLFNSETPQNDPKVQSLMKEISDLDVKLYGVHLEMRRQMNDKDAPFHGRTGPGHGCYGMAGRDMTHRGYGHGRGYW
jgi:hypothetical protein